ncbi:response regulator transcription factor [Gallaecimonas sp. GXIMD4217]|uniref:response regulator transcription factor n=1 Tax=Gallaecimonas sp. GXIMD4217 TaxID=3131927 RepID=UPI00311B0751
MEGFNQLIYFSPQEGSHNLVLLARSLGLKVRHCQDRQALAALLEQHDDALVLLPYEADRLHSCGLPEAYLELVKAAPVVFYQVESRQVDPQAALMMGVRGLLYRDDRLDLLGQAITKLMGGELWFERQTLSQMLDKLLKKEQSRLQELGSDFGAIKALTRRERKIVELVSHGARNKEIANRLNISAHTVKAHLSSVFRKTQSRNRVELLRWAQQHEVFL